MSDHADEACRSLGALGEPGGVVERVFRALTERVAEGTEVRRPLEFNQLCAICGDGSAQGAADVTQVVERYRRADTAFLVPGAEWPLSSNPVIDLSHESLIRQWQRLRGWVAAEAEAAAEAGRLVEDSRRHAQEGGELLRGRSLERAREWQRANHPTAAWLQLCTAGAAGEAADDSVKRFEALQAYIDQSMAAEAQARKRERRRKQALAALAASVVAVSVGAAVVGRSLQQQAQSRELVSRAMLALSQDPVRSAQYALAALEQDSSNDRAEYALRQSMASLETARTEQIKTFDAPITEARYTDDGNRLVVAGDRSVWLLEAASLKTVAQVTTPAAVVKAWQLGQQVIIFTDEAKVQVQTLDGQLRASLSCSGEGNPAASVAYSGAKGTLPAQLAVGCYNGELLLWDLGPDGVLARKALRPGDDRAGTVLALGFSGDGQYLASADSEGLALVWKRGLTDRPWIGLPGNTPLRHGAAIRDIHFHPTETTLLATASDDRTAKVWTLDLDGRRLMPDQADQKGMYTLQHDRAVVGARFVRRADDPTALMTRSDKRVFFWASETAFDARAHHDWVTDVNISGDGELIASASGDGTAHLWSSRAATSIAVLRGHRNEVTRALFSPQGDQVITTSRDRTLRQWRLSRPVMLAASRQWQLSATIDPTGQRALLCGEARGKQSQHCRITPLVDLASRPSIDDDWLQPVAADMVSQGSFSSDGALVMGLGVSHDIYQATGPLLWDAATRKAIDLPWLKAWTWARFVPGRAELLTLRQAADRPGTGELGLWPQAALTRPADAAASAAGAATSAAALAAAGNAPAQVAANRTVQ